MTAQASEIVVYRDNLWDLSRYSTPLPFTAKELKIPTNIGHTGNLAGYLRRFKLASGSLWLDQLYITGKVKISRLPTINGVKASRNEDDLFCEISYNDLNMKVPFTGSILITNDFINELYDHMGFQQPWKFERVMELTFDEGDLIGEEDQSDLFSDFRSRLLNDEKESAGGNDLPEWITSPIELTYDSLKMIK